MNISKNNFILLFLFLLIGNPVFAFKDMHKLSKLNTTGILSRDNPYRRGMKLLSHVRPQDLNRGLKAGTRPKIEFGKNFKPALEELINRKLRSANSKMKISSVKTDKMGNRHIRFQQYYKGIPVAGSEVLAHVDTNGILYKVNGLWAGKVEISVVPKITRQQAAQSITAADKNANPLMEKSTLIIFDGRLAFEVPVENGQEFWNCYVDAQTGEILVCISQIAYGAPGDNGTHESISGIRLDGEDGSEVQIQGWHDEGGNYFLYSKNEERLWRVRNDLTSDWEQRSANNWGTSDKAAVSLAKNFEITTSYVFNVLGMKGYDSSLSYGAAHVHYGTNFGNAFWDPGSEAFFFGDGDGVESGPLTVLDVASHEYGHALTQFSSMLTYSDESGALNESYSDIFASSVEFYAQTDGKSYYPSSMPGKADWLIGEDCWLSSTAIRDMRSPARFLQPSYYKGSLWYEGTDDYGGVHYNNGVQNFAFYILSEGGSGLNDGHIYNVNGIGIKKAAEIAINANLYHLTSSADFTASRDAWIAAAIDWGYDTLPVCDAWSAAGIYPAGASMATLNPILDFGAVQTGTTRLLPLTVYNNGTSSLTVTSLTFDNSFFSFSGNLPLTVSAGWSVDLQIEFSPSDDREQTGGLVISGNSFRNPNISVSLSGRGADAPQYEISPLSMKVTIPTGDSALRYAEISNSGGADLSYVTGAFASETSGELAGYQWSSSDEPGGPAYTWNDISLSGTKLIAVSSYNDTNQSVGIGFSFPFYKRTYTALSVCSNGYITLDAAYKQSNNLQLPNEHAPRTLIAGFFDDLDPLLQGDVYTKSTPDSLIVQFSNVKNIGGAGTYTFQMVLHRDGQIVVYYENMTSVNSATVGIQDSTRTKGLTIAYNQNYIHSNMAVLIRPLPVWLSVSPQKGIIAGNTADELSISMRADTLSAGTYAGFLKNHTNDISAPLPSLLPCTLQVVNRNLMDPVFPSVSFITAVQTVNEGNAISVTAELSKTSLVDIQVPLSFAGTSQRQTDYTMPGMVVVCAGSLQGSVLCQTRDNQDDQSDKTIIVSMGEPRFARPGAVGLQIITVHDNDPPQITSVASLTATEDEQYYYQATATNPAGFSLTWQLSNEPAGMTINQSTGMVAWVPGEGVLSSGLVTLSVCDNDLSPLTGYQQFELTVTPVNDPPVLGNIGPKEVIEGNLLSFSINVSDPDGPSVSLSTSGLPSGAVFTNNGGSTGGFEWMPGYDQAGSYELTFRCSDGTSSDSEIVVITVTDAGTGTINVSSLTPNTKVYRYSSGNWRGSFEFSGSAQITGVEPGVQWLSLISPGNRDWCVPVAVEAGKTVDVNAQYHPCAPVAFATPETLMTSSGPIVIGAAVCAIRGDFDRDSDPELAVALSNGNLQLYDSLNGTYFSTGSFSTGMTGIRCIRAIDWDNDTRLDIIVSNTDGQLQLLRNNGVFLFEAGPVLFSTREGLSGFDIEDMNDDDTMDFIMGFDDGTISMALSSGGGWTESAPLFSDGTPLTVSGTNLSPVCIDINGDGSKDLLIGNGAGEVFCHYQVAGGFFVNGGAANFNGAAVNMPGKIAISSCHDIQGRFPVLTLTNETGNVLQACGNLKGDFMEDVSGEVDIVDLGLFGDAWGFTENSINWNGVYNLDLTPSKNGLQVIDLQDLAEFGDCWGKRR